MNNNMNVKEAANTVLYHINDILSRNRNQIHPQIINHISSFCNQFIQSGGQNDQLGIMQIINQIPATGVHTHNLRAFIVENIKKWSDVIGQNMQHQQHQNQYMNQSMMSAGGMGSPSLFSQDTSSSFNIGAGPNQQTQNSFAAFENNQSQMQMSPNMTQVDVSNPFEINTSNNTSEDKPITNTNKFTIEDLRQCESTNYGTFKDLKVEYPTSINPSRYFKIIHDKYIIENISRQSKDDDYVRLVGYFEYMKSGYEIKEYNVLEHICEFISSNPKFFRGTFWFDVKFTEYENINYVDDSSLNKLVKAIFETSPKRKNVPSVYNEVDKILFNIDETIKELRKNDADILEAYIMKYVNIVLDKFLRTYPDDKIKLEIENKDFHLLFDGTIEQYLNNNHDFENATSREIMKNIKLCVVSFLRAKFNPLTHKISDMFKYAANYDYDILNTVHQKEDDDNPLKINFAEYYKLILSLEDKEDELKLLMDNVRSKNGIDLATKQRTIFTNVITDLQSHTQVLDYELFKENSDDHDVIQSLMESKFLYNLMLDQDGDIVYRRFKIIKTIEDKVILEKA